MALSNMELGVMQSMAAITKVVKCSYIRNACTYVVSLAYVMLEVLFRPSQSQEVTSESPFL